MMPLVESEQPAQTSFHLDTNHLMPGLRFSDLHWEYFLPNEYMPGKKPQLWAADEMLSGCVLLTWPCQGYQCLRPMGMAGLPLDQVGGERVKAASFSRMTVPETLPTEMRINRLSSPRLLVHSPPMPVCVYLCLSFLHSPCPVRSNPELGKLLHRTS